MSVSKQGCLEGLGSGILRRYYYISNVNPSQLVENAHLGLLKTLVTAK